MRQEISRESSLFSTVSREISEENSLWLLRVLIQTTGGPLYVFEFTKRIYEGYE